MSIAAVRVAIADQIRPLLDGVTINGETYTIPVLARTPPRLDGAAGAVVLVRFGGYDPHQTMGGDVAYGFEIVPHVPLGSNVDYEPELLLDELAAPTGAASIYQAYLSDRTFGGVGSAVMTEIGEYLQTDYAGQKFLVCAHSLTVHTTT